MLKLLGMAMKMQNFVSPLADTFLEYRIV